MIMVRELDSPGWNRLSKRKANSTLNMSCLGASDISSCLVISKEKAPHHTLRGWDANPRAKFD
jgi:hypothetical protein